MKTGFTFTRLPNGVWVDADGMPWADQEGAGAMVKQALIDTYLNSDRVKTSQIEVGRTYHIDVQIFTGSIVAVT